MPIDDADFEAVVSDLYAGTLDPAAWERGVRRIARLVGGLGPLIMVVDPQSGRLLRHELHDYDPAVFARFSSEGWDRKDIRVPLAAPRVGQTVVEAQLLPKGEWERTEVFNEFLYPHDAGWFLSSSLSATKFAAFSIQASRDRGPFGEKDIALVQRFLPHVTRALEIKDRLDSQLLQVRGLNAAIDRAAFGAMVLDQRGYILDASEAALVPLSRVRAIARETTGMYRFAEPHGSRLRRLIASRLQDGALLQDGLLHIPRGGGRPPLSLVLAPIPATSTQWVASDPRWLLLVFDSERRIAASAELIQADLNLSAREAEVAARLAAGSDLPAIAQQLDITVQTVRAHLKAIFQKTQLHSQSDLVRRIVTGPATHSAPHHLP